MNIDNNKIAALRDLITWVQTTANKAANFEISFWNHSTRDTQKIEYRIWIEGSLHQCTEDLDYLVYLIPQIKAMFLSAKEA
jgi:hypothetical protein